jgi:hypothetical protein
MNAKRVDHHRDDAARIVALFSILIHAWQTNDFSEAARTRSELERLGVKVRILRRPSSIDDGGQP